MGYASMYIVPLLPYVVYLPYTYSCILVLRSLDNSLKLTLLIVLGVMDGLKLGCCLAFSGIGRFKEVNTAAQRERERERAIPVLNGYRVK